MNGLLNDRSKKFICIALLDLADRPSCVSLLHPMSISWFNRHGSIPSNTQVKPLSICSDLDVVKGLTVPSGSKLTTTINHHYYLCVLFWWNGWQGYDIVVCGWFLFVIMTMMTNYFVAFGKCANPKHSHFVAFQPPKYVYQSLTTFQSLLSCLPRLKS